MQQDLKLEVSAPQESFAVSAPFIVNIKLTNSGDSPLYLFRYGFEVGLQLKLEVVDEEGRILVIPPLKDIEPDLSRENFLALAPGDCVEVREDVAPILRSGVLEPDRRFYLKFRYTAKDYAEYAREMYQINAFAGEVESSRLGVTVKG